MAEVPRAALDYLTDEIESVSESAQSAVLRVLVSIEWTPDNVARCREVVVEALSLVLPTYTDLSAQASADLYDSLRASALGEAHGASAICGYDADATEGAVRALVQRVVGGGDVESFNRAVLDRVDYEVKRAAGNSTIENGLADPARVRFACVPTGAETCGFCMMLAGRGFVYLTRESAGEFHHYHAHCDCRVVAGFDDSTGVEGYDPGEYLALYSEARSRLGGGASAGQTAAEIERVLSERRDAEVARIRAKGFEIPDAKLSGYALNLEHESGRNKAGAFQSALGFTAEDAAEVAYQVYRWVDGEQPTYRDTTRFGDSYTTHMTMTGKSGKTAKVTVGWLRHDDGKLYLTTIYVDK